MRYNKIIRCFDDGRRTHQNYWGHRRTPGYEVAEGRLRCDSLSGHAAGDASSLLRPSRSGLHTLFHPILVLFLVHDPIWRTSSPYQFLSQGTSLSPPSPSLSLGATVSATSSHTLLLTASILITKLHHGVVLHFMTIPSSFRLLSGRAVLGKEI